jgi:radical SAM-linked protein
LKNKNLEKSLIPILYRVSKPGRYVGGEYGSIIKDGSLKLKVVLSYPDLYEIGMCNYAIKILYNRINSLEGVSCERVFAPDRDMEEELRTSRLPLFSLESTTPLVNFDILAFSVGYEMTYTNLLNILDLGGITLIGKEREEGEPIVMAAGPAVTNPAPISRFVDAVFIGEGEEWATENLPLLADMKSRGARRTEILSKMLEHASIWAPDKNNHAKRAIWTGFSENPSIPCTPVPNIRIIQDHGVVEIMRGCPNGCRFCHAGIFYRPFRMKKANTIINEVDDLVFNCGYREITLSSLSSGDYSSIDVLIKALNVRFRGINTSFTVPSIKIDSMALGLLTELSLVRKGGLTFAVETPVPSWQRSINKSVTREKTVDILKEAKRKGWNKAKFYFMLGLPVSDNENEASFITDFLLDVQKETGMQLRINIATFIPKPHTPFQWARQISEEEALERIQFIKWNLKGKSFRVGYHSPFLSSIEGIMSRGDERIGGILLSAFNKGARLDAWEEHFDRNLWGDVLHDAGWDILSDTLRARSVDEKLPWESVQLGVTDRFLISEKKRAEEQKFTSICETECMHPCGVCSGKTKVQSEEIELSLDLPPAYIPAPEKKQKFLFSMTKTGDAIFLSHLDTMNILERSLLRSGFHAVFSRGYNPKPRIEFASPIPLGLSSDDEIVSAEIYNAGSARDFKAHLNEFLPEGLRVNKVMMLKNLEAGHKIHSLMSLYWGSTFTITHWEAEDLWKELSEKLFELDRSGRDYKNEINPIETIVREGESLTLIYKKLETKGSGILKVLGRMIGDFPLGRGIRVRRTATWAKNECNERSSYFDVF